uniref:dATP/dGTP diphosphohydrolase N-terminal domain-containing protein n=1 Tax=Burkholderia phage vB_BgluM-SURPRISE13 TaxID=3159457 RepID=A0AAU7PFA9_9VIRU
MKFKEAKLNSNNPALSDEDKQRFMYEFANLCVVAVRFNGGHVVEEDDNNPQAENYFAMAYLMGWKWSQNILIDVAKGRGWPEPEFVDFVHDMVNRLGLIPYNPNDPKSHEEFEAAMSGRCSLTKEAGTGKYAFAAQIAFEAWCKVHNRKHTPHVEQQINRPAKRDRQED